MMKDFKEYLHKHGKEYYEQVVKENEEFLEAIEQSGKKLIFKRGGENGLHGDKRLLDKERL